MAGFLDTLKNKDKEKEGQKASPFAKKPVEGGAASNPFAKKTTGEETKKEEKTSPFKLGSLSKKEPVEETKVDATTSTESKAQDASIINKKKDLLSLKKKVSEIQNENKEENLEEAEETKVEIKEEAPKEESKTSKEEEKEEVKAIEKEEKTETEKPKQEDKKKAPKAKKEEEEVKEEVVVKAEKSTLNFKEALALVTVNYEDEEWDALTVDINNSIAQISIGTDMTPAEIRILLAKIDELKQKIWIPLTKLKTHYEQLAGEKPEGLIVRIKQTAYTAKHKNDMDRRKAGIEACENHKGTNLFELLEVVQARYTYLREANNNLNFKKDCILTYAGSLKKEN